MDGNFICFLEDLKIIEILCFMEVGSKICSLLPLWLMFYGKCDVEWKNIDLMLRIRGIKLLKHLTWQFIVKISLSSLKLIFVNLSHSHKVMIIN